MDCGALSIIMYIFYQFFEELHIHLSNKIKFTFMIAYILPS